MNMWEPIEVENNSANKYLQKRDGKYGENYFNNNKNVI